MKFRIFQSYYEPQQKTLLDSEFTPLDNTDNLYPELREYPILKKCHQQAQQEGLDAWDISVGGGVKKCLIYQPEIF